MGWKMSFPIKNWWFSGSMLICWTVIILIHPNILVLCWLKKKMRMQAPPKKWHDSPWVGGALLDSVWTILCNWVPNLSKKPLKLWTWCFTQASHMWYKPKVNFHIDNMGEDSFWRFWANYNISLTWILRPYWDDFPNPNHHSQWGRSEVVIISPDLLMIWGYQIIFGNPQMEIQ